jgi:hypothetical protein
VSPTKSNCTNFRAEQIVIRPYFNSHCSNSNCRCTEALREKNNDESHEKVKHTPDDAAGVLLPGATTYSTTANVAAPLGVGVGGVHVASPLPTAPPATQDAEKIAAAAAKVVAAASATATATTVTGSGKKANEEESAKPPAVKGVQTQEAEAVAGEEKQAKTQVVHGAESVQAGAEVLELPEPTKIEHDEESEHIEASAQDASTEPTAEEIQEALKPDDDEV